MFLCKVSVLFLPSHIDLKTLQRVFVEEDIQFFKKIVKTQVNKAE